MLETIQREWGVISAAPFSFCFAVAAIGAAIWTVMHFVYKERLENLRESRDYFKTKSEREAAGAAKAGRSLSEAQRARLLAKLSSDPGDIEIIFANNDEEALEFSREIVKLFERAEWRIGGWTTLLVGLPSSGLELTSGGGARAQMLLDAFRSEGIDLRSTINSGENRIRLMVWKQPKN